MSLYRHINEAEDTHTKNTAWDWSDSVDQGIQPSLSDQEETSMSDQEEPSMEEHSTVEKDKEMNIEVQSSTAYYQIILELHVTISSRLHVAIVLFLALLLWCSFC